jgi:hypothetical protein
MIDETLIKFLEEHSKDKPVYLKYINNLDTMYDMELIQTLCTIMKLQKESLEMMINLLQGRQTYLATLTYTTNIIIEKYNDEKNNIIDYYVYPQITPNIPDGNKLAFSKAGMWFKDENVAVAFAEILKTTKYNNGEIKKIEV